MIERPEKIFPCHCCDEGIVVTTFDCQYGDTVAVTRDPEDEDLIEYYTLQFAFWGHGPYNDGRLPWRKRLRLMWYVWKHGHPWTTMVTMNLDVAKNFAHHILYRVDQMKEKMGKRRDELKKHKKETEEDLNLGMH